MEEQERLVVYYKSFSSRLVDSQGEFLYIYIYINNRIITEDTSL